MAVPPTTPSSSDGQRRLATHTAIDRTSSWVVTDSFGAEGCDVEGDFDVGRRRRALVGPRLEAAVDAVPAGVLQSAAGQQPVGAGAPGPGRREAPSGLAVQQHSAT